MGYDPIDRKLLIVRGFVMFDLSVRRTGHPLDSTLSTISRALKHPLVGERQICDNTNEPLDGLLSPAELLAMRSGADLRVGSSI